jgi:hypothetical protein
MVGAQCGMTTLTDAWHSAASALPAGWRLEGLRCSSTGLSPSQRGDDWIAEACGPDDACIRIQSSDPQDALATLTRKLVDLR